MKSIDWRAIVTIPLLAAAAWLTWSTVEGLRERRVVRTQLAEISHARYGVMNADRWVALLVPALDKRVDELDLAPASGASLRPMVESALYRLLDDVKAQMSAKPAPGSPAAAGPMALMAGNPMIVNMIVGALKPHVPEYTTMVLKELGRPQSRTAVKNYIRGALAEGARSTFGAVDMRLYNQILKQHGCADGESCKQKIASEIRAMDDRIEWQWIGALLATALAFVIVMIGRPLLGRASAAALLLFTLVLLLGGLLTPMLEVEAKLSSIKLTLLGTPVAFTDQVLYFQSKSVFEVFRALVDTHRAEMWFVAGLVLLFCCVFPGLKLLASTAALFRPSLLARSRVVKFFALESSKWSMADVLALAIFMSFVAFNGLIGNTLGMIRETGADVTIPTDSSKVLPGYYLFIGFCLASLFLSRKLGKGIALARE
jgi:hypothetical protein